MEALEGGTSKGLGILEKVGVTPSTRVEEVCLEMSIRVKLLGMHTLSPPFHSHPHLLNLTLELKKLGSFFSFFLLAPNNAACSLEAKLSVSMDSPPVLIAPPGPTECSPFQQQRSKPKYSPLISLCPNMEFGSGG